MSINDYLYDCPSCNATHSSLDTGREEAFISEGEPIPACSHCGQPQCIECWEEESLCVECRSAIENGKPLPAAMEPEQ